MRLAAASLLFASALAAQPLDWIATAAFGSVKLRVALHLGGVAPAADSIDQDAFGLPLAGLRRDGRRLSFTIPKLGARFTGIASAGSIDGQWKQRDGEFPLRFVPGNIRPQEPAPPYPYEERPVAIYNGGVRLAGTLTLPRALRPRAAVVLLTGSGPQDRNGTASGHRPFLTWADFLTRRGFAVLRTDDRGVGGSSGRLLDSTDEELAADALACVRYLETLPEIGPAPISLVGHSEGGLVAPLAAARAKDVAFLVLLAGPALSGDRILLAQSERIDRVMGVPESAAARKREAERRIVSLAREGRGRREIQASLDRELAAMSPEERALVSLQAGGQVATAASRWFRWIVSYDPRPVLERLACPVLALYGGLDLQVPADLNAPVMEKALAGNRQSRVTVLPGLNHMFQRAATGSPVEYAQIEETVAPGVLEMVARWIERQ